MKSCDLKEKPTSIKMKAQTSKSKPEKLNIIAQGKYQSINVMSKKKYSRD